MFRIGEFAELARVSARVLRHYDRIGLLQPEQVDPTTNYRYYAAAQLAEINQIVALRDLGFGLEEIRGLIDDAVSTEQLRGMLRLRQAEVAEEVAEAERRLRSIDSRIAQLEGGDASVDVVVRTIPAMTVWAMPYETSGIEQSLDALSCMVRDMSEVIEDLAPPYGSATWTADADASGFAMTFAVPFDDRLSAPASRLGFTVETLPAVEVAAAVRSSDRQDIHITNAALGRWIERESAHVAGPIREVLLADPIIGDPEQIVEVQVPIGRGLVSDVVAREVLHDPRIGGGR